MPLKRSSFSRYVWLTASLVVAMAALFLTYAVLERQVDTAHTQRLRAVQLAEELRLSSDELTRMARTYIATGDPRYKARYQDVAAIRDGRQPRPTDYPHHYLERNRLWPKP